MKTGRRLPLAAGAAALSLAGLAVPALAHAPGCAAGPHPATAAAMAPMPDAPEVLVALPPGTEVVLPGQVRPVVVQQAAPMPGMHLIADMQAMMHRMTAQMGALMNAPMWGPSSPSAMIRAAFGPHPWAVPGAVPDRGTSVMVTSVSTGHGSCSESVSYTYPDGSGKPVVKVWHTGDACGAIRLSGPGLTPAALSAAPDAPPPARPMPEGPRLIPASYRTPVAPPSAAPHS